MSTVLLLTGTTMGDALGASGRALRGVFEPLGYRFAEINFSASDAMERLGRAIGSAEEIAFVLTHVGMGMDLLGKTPDGQELNLWVGNRIPFISLFGDSPAYFFDRHVVPGDNFACLYAFPEHLAYRKVLPMQRGLLGQTPLRLMDDTPVGEINFRVKERGKLLFLKNGNDPDRLVELWRKQLSPALHMPLLELAADLSGRLASAHSTRIDEAVREHFDRSGIDITSSTKLRLFFVAQLDDYLRRVKSTSMAKALRKFPVEIHGYNWEHVDFSRGPATFVAGGDYSASRALIADALGMIDMSPNTTDGPHDRALRAFGLHTLCITNKQAFFDQHFDNSEAFSFEFGDESLESRVAEAIANPRRYVELGVEQGRQFRARFDSVQFGERIVDIAGMLRAATAARPPMIQNFFVWPTKV
jgi:hypothetical protein